MKSNLISGKSYIEYENKAKEYAKRLSGDNYDEALMQSALTRSFQLVQEGKLRMSYDYCRGVDFGSPMYERFDVISN
ncbi:hypothetical protein [Vibrio cincinnatiensis]|uniref:hypothetical protein n=1 Tax=Vibrio cincinnatiensis TaxID=675 RepID=UPI0038AB85C9